MSFPVFVVDLDWVLVPAILGRSNMATSKVTGKSSEDAFLETMGEVIDRGAAKMNREQLRQSEKKFNAAIDRAAPVRKRRRESA